MTNNRDMQPTVTEEARNAADEFFPPNLWKKEARDDLAQFLARFEAETLVRHRSQETARSADVGRDQNYRDCVNAAIAPAREWYAKSEDGGRDITIYLLNNIMAELQSYRSGQYRSGVPERVQPPYQPAAWDIPDTVREQIRADIINTPETADFMAGVPLEAAHQRERWAAGHDAGKSPFDWFWLIGYLAQKAAASAVAGDREKAMHHTISTAAALANWHAALAGIDTSMRPGIDPADHQGATQ